MASPVPAKSRTLHNFSSLSGLKWNKHPRNQRSSNTARQSSSPRQTVPFDDSQQRQSPQTDVVPSHRGDLTTEPLPSPSPPRHSSASGGCFDDSMSSPPSSYAPLLPGPCNDDAAHPQRDSPIRGGAAFESDSSLGDKKSLIEYRRQSRNSVSRTKKNGVSSRNRSATPEKLQFQSKEPESGNREGKKESRSSRILIRFPSKEKKDCVKLNTQEELPIHNTEIEEDGKQMAPLDDENRVQKTWNFRPRKKKGKQVIDDDGRAFKNSASPVQEKGVHSAQVNHAVMPEAKKGKKRGFSVSLSREEIEADIFAMTGSKPRRRPKKRPKAVQEEIDYLLPGSWLQSITANSYRVSQNPGKGCPPGI